MSTIYSFETSELASSAGHGVSDFVIQETSPGSGMAATVYLKVAMPANATKVSVSFDPVAAEEVRQTRMLNQTVRLGFLPPAVSTR